MSENEMRVIYRVYDYRDGRGKVYKTLTWAKKAAAKDRVLYIEPMYIMDNGAYISAPLSLLD
jgi:hypothetical protein